MSRLPTKNIDYTSRDYEAFRDLLITKLQEKMPEYTDTSETDAGIVIIEALIFVIYLLIVAISSLKIDVLKRVKARAALADGDDAEEVELDELADIIEEEADKAKNAPQKNTNKKKK